MSTITRRKFIAASGLGAAGMVTTSLGSRLAFAAPGSPQTGDAVVVVFLRGGADGLNVAPPFGYPSYRQLRPTIAIPPPGQNGGALALNQNGNVAFSAGIEGVVGLHPAFAPIHQTLWAQGRLAVVPATGMPPNESATRSHFEAEQYVARGSASGAVAGGFLGRMMNVQNPQAIIAAVNKSQRSNLLAGARNASAVPNLNNYGVNGFRNRDQAKTALAVLNAGPDTVSGRGREVLTTVDRIQELNNDLRPGYPNSSLGRSLSEVSTLLNANLGLHAAAIDSSGYDTHNNQGRAGDQNGRLYRNLDDLARCLRAFADDTNGLEEITVCVITEFGRTINENGNGGTDHGRAATHLFMGAGIQGGVFCDDYPDVIADDPDTSDLTVTTDYRKPLSEIFANRVGINDLNTVFPTYAMQGNALGLTRA